MRKLTLILAGAALIGFTSCEKCADCACSYVGEYTFEDGFNSDIETSVRSTLDQAALSNYPVTEEEVCSKRGEFDDEISDYEAMSKTFTDQGTDGQGNEWTYKATYTCSCEE